MTKQCTLCLRRARLRARDVSFRRDQRVLPSGRRVLRGPTGRVTGTAGRSGESDLCNLATAETTVWPETCWNPLGRLHGRMRFEGHSFDRCDAAPQFFANYELDVFIDFHMDDLRGTGRRLAMDLVQTNLSRKVRFKTGQCTRWA